MGCRGAEIFLAAVALLSFQDFDGLEETLDFLSQHLISATHNVSLQFKVL